HMEAPREKDRRRRQEPEVGERCGQRHRADLTEERPQAGQEERVDGRKLDRGRRADDPLIRETVALGQGTPDEHVHTVIVPHAGGDRPPGGEPDAQDQSTEKDERHPAGGGRGSMIPTTVLDDLSSWGFGARPGRGCAPNLRVPTTATMAAGAIVANVGRLPATQSHRTSTARGDRLRLPSMHPDALVRPLDPSVPTNRAVMALMPVGALAAGLRAWWMPAAGVPAALWIGW